jgi:hypothetical protein
LIYLKIGKAKNTTPYENNTKPAPNAHTSTMYSTHSTEHPQKTSH